MINFLGKLEEAPLLVEGKRSLINATGKNYLGSHWERDLNQARLRPATDGRRAGKDR